MAWYLPSTLPLRASRASTESVVSAAGAWYALPVPTKRRPVCGSTAGVVQTEPPSRPGGTVKVFHRILPVRSSRETTLPRVLTAASLVSPYSADWPM